MFESVYKGLIEKLKSEDFKHFEVTTGYIDLTKFNEDASSNKLHDFMDSYIIVFNVQVQGLFTVSAFTAAKKFIELKSEYGYTDLSHNFKVEAEGVYVNVYSEFPSIHRGKLEVYYKLSTFIEGTAAKILKGSVQYLQIISRK